MILEIFHPAHWAVSKQASDDSGASAKFLGAAAAKGGVTSEEVVDEEDEDCGEVGVSGSSFVIGGDEGSRAGPRCTQENREWETLYRLSRNKESM